MKTYSSDFAGALQQISEEFPTLAPSVSIEIARFFYELGGKHELERLRDNMKQDEQRETLKA